MVLCVVAFVCSCYANLTHQVQIVVWSVPVTLLPIRLFTIWLFRLAHVKMYTNTMCLWMFTTLWSFWYELTRIRQWRDWRSSYHDLDDRRLWSRLYSPKHKKKNTKPKSTLSLCWKRHSKNRQSSQVSDPVSVVYLWEWEVLIERIQKLLESARSKKVSHSSVFQTPADRSNISTHGGVRMKESLINQAHTHQAAPHSLLLGLISHGHWSNSKHQVTFLPSLYNE